jgi:hypothetical protein
MQAVGDCGQGWGNAILYVLLSHKIRQKLAIACLGHGVRRNRGVSNNIATAPSSHPIQYPSETYFAVPYTNAFNTSYGSTSEAT